MTRRSNREVTLDRLFDGLRVIAESLGFQREVRLIGFYDADRTLVLGRRGSAFCSELLAFQAKRSPKWVLTVFLIASPHSLDEFSREALEGRGVAERLNRVLVGATGSRLEDVLPKAIPVEAEADVPRLLSGLRSELGAAVSTGFNWLRKRWDRNQAPGTDR